MINKNIQIWDYIYKSGQSNLSYPNENLVRILNQKEIANGGYKKIKILDFGFGSGNNLLHLLNVGMDVYGIEVSEHAKEITLNKIKNAGLHIDSDNLKILKNNSELHSSFQDNFFDIIIAWQVIYYNTFEEFKLLLKSFKGLLKNNGILICTMIRKNDIAITTGLQKSEYEFIISNFIANQEDSIITLLETESEIEKYFSIFKNLEIGYFENMINNKTSSHWIIYGKK